MPKGIFGQTTFDPATGAQREMFDTSRPAPVSPPIKGSKSALDPRHTGKLFDKGKIMTAEGHWVTIEGHHILIKDPIGGGKGFSRAELHRKVIAHHESVQGKGSYTAHDEKTLNAAAGAGDPFTFHKQLPAEIKAFQAGRPELRSLFKVTDDVRKAGGADAFGELGDKYLDIAEAKAGSPLRHALNTARGSNDPEVRFMAAIHDHLPAASERSAQGTIDVSKLHVGQSFKIQGDEFHVLEDADGFKVLSGPTDYPEVPLEALKKIPIDRGSLLAAKGAKLKSDNVAPFSRFILPTDSEEPRAVPMSLSGYPTEIEGQPVEYRRKEICRAGRTVRDVSGNPFHVTRDRIDKWTRNFEKQKENGIPVFIPTKHSEILSSDNRGYVVEMAREGDSLYAVEQLIGEDAIRDVARNDQSVYIMLNAEDDRGNVYDECIQHVALTPAPQITGLNGFAKVAASRGPAADAVVLTLATTSETERSFDMKPETSQKLREKLGVAKTVTDEQLAEQVYESFLLPPKPDATATAAMSRLEEENKALKAERDEATTKVVAMSRLNPKVDDDTAFLVGESIATKRDIAVNNGAVTPAIAKELDKLFSDGDKPSAVAMSRLPGSSKPLAMRVWETLADNKPAALGEKTGKQLVTAMSKLKEEENGKEEEKADPAEVARLRAMNHIPEPAAAK